jgi:putative hydrolase of the HAD superfamily
VLLLAFDADDTLWHNEIIFSTTQEKFRQLLSAYHNPEWIEKKLYETEMRNIHHFGYGIKGFTLSMIETAIELSEGRIKGGEIKELINLAKEMLKSPVKLLENVKETISLLAGTYNLMLLTKGDLFDQESKIARSGLARYFAHIEIVSKKETETYRKILQRHNIAAGNFLMVGNSLKSDIFPVIALGGRAVYIPYHITWEHETLDEPKNSAGHFTLDHIGRLPDLLKTL